MNSKELQQTLAAIRAGVNELDVLAIVNAMTAQWPSGSLVGEALLDCALAVDEITNTPEEIPERRFEERQYDAATTPRPI